MKLQELSKNKLITEMPNEEFREISLVLKHIFQKYMNLNFEFSDHAKNRIIDNSVESRDVDISKTELYQMLVELIKRYRDDILSRKNKNKEFIAVATNRSNNINLVFKIDFQNKKKTNIFRLITIMRKQGFVSREMDRVFYV